MKVTRAALSSSWYFVVTFPAVNCCFGCSCVHVCVVDVVAVNAKAAFAPLVGAAGSSQCHR